MGGGFLTPVCTALNMLLSGFLSMAAPPSAVTGGGGPSTNEEERMMQTSRHTWSDRRASAEGETVTCSVREDPGKAVESVDWLMKFHICVYKP